MADENNENVEYEEQDYTDDEDNNDDETVNTDQDDQNEYMEDDPQQYADSDDDEQDRMTASQDGEEPTQERRVARTNGQAVAIRQWSVPGRAFNPMGAIRAGHLRLARNWAETGSVYAAIAAYMDIVNRYPGSGAARAATEGLLELARTLEGNGMYYTAQNIFRQLEQVVWE